MSYENSKLQNIILKEEKNEKENDYEKNGRYLYGDCTF